MIDQQKEQGLTLRHYLDVVRRRLWLVLVITAVAIGAAAAISYTQHKMYAATTKIVVGQGNSLFQPGQANAVQPFTATMGALVKSNVVASRVIKQLGLPNETTDNLLASVSVSFNPETAVLDVRAEDESPARAERVAAAFASVFSNLVKKRFGQTKPVVIAGVPQPPLTATIWDPARADSSPVSPKPARNMALAGVLGLVLGLLAAFVREHFDRALRTREDVEATYGVPVIGQIPFVRARDATVETFWGDFTQGGESFRALRANLQYLAIERPLRTILVASPLPEQGKTTVTANLAVALAQSGASACAVEGDLRRPRLHEPLAVSSAHPGLTNVLIGATSIEDAIRDVPVPSLPTNAGGERTIGVVTSGPQPPNPSELLASVGMAAAVARLTELFDYVVVDSPPLLAVSDALELSRVVDGVILVVRRNRTTTDEARETRAVLDRLDIRLLGVVFTDVEAVAAYHGPYGGTPRRAVQPVATTQAATRDI